MEPRVITIERVFPVSVLYGRTYQWFENVFDGLVEEMKRRICGCFVDSQATFVMNRELYKIFYSVAPMVKGPYWDGIYVKEDLTPECFSILDKEKGRIRLEYEEPVYIPFELTERRDNSMPTRGFKTMELYFAIPKDLKIEKVIFNDPATIVFWNDGTKTVVKCQKLDTFDPEKGLAMCIVKKAIGLKDFYKAFNPALKELWDREEDELINGLKEVVK